MGMNYRCVDTNLAKCELALNKIDYIPFLSAVSGAVRILAGIVETVAGIAFAALKVLHAILKDSAIVFRQARFGLIYSLHGLANIIRGSVAVFAGVNLLLIAYDCKIGRLNYRLEPDENKFYPLNQRFI